MEARIGGKAQHLYGPVIPELMVVGKRTMEWDLNDWSWDGDLFSATAISSVPSDCRSRQLFPVESAIPTPNTGFLNTSPSFLDEKSLRNERENRESEKRRRELNDEVEPLNLKLGGQTYRVMEAEEGKNGKKSKTVAAATNRAVCQVEDCRADLTGAKDYHRRHKVCEVHSKATSALVGSVMQRFCQQCSRFHALQEFDEGKRSCRRRLAGHNRRRRKMPPETVASGGSLVDERGSNYLLVSLLRILSNLHTSNSSDQVKDQDLLSHLMRNLASLAASDNGKDISGLYSASKNLQNITMPMATEAPGNISNSLSGGRIEKGTSMDEQHNGSYAISCHTRDSVSANASILENGAGTMKMTDIDLNNAYDDSQDSVENLESYEASVNLGIQSRDSAPWEHQTQKSSPPQTSGNSGSTTTLSPSSSSGEAQGRTDRIVFKLFGKDPTDFPVSLRKQVLDWLSNTPTDIESYIRPGCIILTIYLRLENSMWEELSCDLSSSLTKLLEASDESFWRTGWVYARVQHRVAFLYSGNVILDTLLPLKSHKNPRILSINPIAVPFSQKAEFSVKGYDLVHTTSRLLCALEGKYLTQESCSDMSEGCDEFTNDDETQCLNFSCSIPDTTGRGFVEIEDHSLNSSFFPFIVAEQDVCSEIRTLESAIESVETFDDVHVESELMQARNDALEFIQEMGWLLHRNHLKIRLASMDPNSDLFPLCRFRWLIDFSIEHDWCAVTKTLLNIFFGGTVDAGVHPSNKLALQDMCLLHKAVRRNSRSMVEMLLRYIPDGAMNKSHTRLLFKPDASGPGGLTPLHIAASSDGSEGVLDALTDDPGSVGLEAWKSARDGTGLTPHDYASLRGYFSYIPLVQTKMNKKLGNRQVVLDIPGSLLEYNAKQKPTDGHRSAKVASFQTEKREMVMPVQLPCSCQQTMAYRNPRSSLAFYRPAMLSMVAIAAVCVCVALLFKSSPEVLYVFKPFRWEHLEYGSS